MTVEQVAKELKMSPQAVREYMKRGLLDIGIVLPNITGKTKRYKYVIIDEKYEAFKRGKQHG